MYPVTQGSLARPHIYHAEAPVHSEASACPTHHLPTHPPIHLPSHLPTHPPAHLLQAYSACEPGEDHKAILGKIAAGLGVVERVGERVMAHPEARSVLRSVLRAWLPLAEAALQVRGWVGGWQGGWLGGWRVAGGWGALGVQWECLCSGLAGWGRCAGVLCEQIVSIS